MDKSEIEQVYYLKKELRMWESQLQQLRERSKKYPVSGNTPEEIQHKEELLMKKIAAKSDELLTRTLEIMEYIDGVSDSQMRQILNYRCIQLDSWRRIAVKLGGKNTADGVRMAYNRFFEKN